MSQQYYVRFKGRVLGPMAGDKMRGLVKSGQVTRMHEISPDGIEWQSAGDVAEFYPQKKVVAAVVRDEGNAASQRPLEPATAEWYAMVGDERQGPVDLDTISAWVAASTIGPNCLVWKEGMANWVAANVAMPKLFAVAASHVASGSMNSSQVGSSNHVIDSPTEISNLISNLISELRARRVWVMILAVSCMFLSACYLLGMGLALVREITAPASSGAQAVAGIMAALIGLVISVLAFIAVLNLLRFGNSLSVLQYAPTEPNVLRSLRRLSAFWLYAGLVVLIFLLFLAAVIVWLSIVSPRFPSFLT